MVLSATQNMPERLINILGRVKEKACLMWVMKKKLKFAVICGVFRARTFEYWSLFWSHVTSHTQNHRLKRVQLCFFLRSLCFGYLIVFLCIFKVFWPHSRITAFCSSLWITGDMICSGDWLSSWWIDFMQPPVVWNLANANYPKYMLESSSWLCKVHILFSFRWTST